MILNGSGPDAIQLTESNQMKPIPLIPILLLAAALAACDKNKDDSPAQAEPSAVDQVKQQAKEAVNSTKEFVVQQKEQLQKSLSSKLDEFDRKLDELKGKSSQVSEKTKNELRDTLSQLQQKKEIAAKKLEQLKSSGAGAWQEIKAGAEKAFAELDQAFKDASAHFRSEEPVEQK